MKRLRIIPQITLRDTDSLNRYLTEVSCVGGVLTAKEEVELALRVQDGDKEAEKELILRNLRFVISVAKQYQCSESPLSDLISEGNIGLIMAARKFDASRGNKFISYAVWWIRQSILKYLSEHGRAVRAPLNRIAHIHKIKQATLKLEQTLQREPTEGEVFESLRDIMREDEFKTALRIRMSTKSIDRDIQPTTSSRAEVFNLKDVLESPTQTKPDEGLVIEDLRVELNRILDRLPPRNKYVLEHFYGLNGERIKTLEEIAQNLDLTKERIRQLKNSSLTQLKRKYSKKTF